MLRQDFLSCFFLFHRYVDKIFIIVDTSYGEIMKNISIWNDTVSKKKYCKLVKNIDTDVLIIGGGITGVSTGYFLKDSGLNVVLVEQNRLGCSVTGRSTGKLSYLQNDLLTKIGKCCGRNSLEKYIKSQRDAIDLIVSLIHDEHIDCDLRNVDSYVYTNHESEISKLKNLENMLSSMGIRVLHDKINYVQYKYCFGVKDTYLFHPLKFVQELALKGNFSIYEGTSIKKIDKENGYYLCYTDKCRIKARYVVIASHYPYFTFPFLFSVKASLEKSYLCASKMKCDNISFISYDNPFISIRNYKDYFIYLSNSHSISSDVDDSKHFDELLKKVNDLKLKPDYLWSNIDIMTNDGLPYIGKIKDNMLVGTGYNTWGLANGVMAGKIMCDIILKKNNKYQELFSPNRVNMCKISGSIIDGIKSIQGYINGYLNKNTNVFYRKEDGKDIMVYKDSDKEYKVYQRCPHLGCKLVFNEVEKTWDCPCHGSRFNIDGKCISGPSNTDISIKQD